MTGRWRVAHHLRQRLLLAAAVVLVAGSTFAVLPPACATAGTSSGSRAQVPVYAYFYQWFTPSSWTRAKQDFPLAGRYGSDDAHVLRAQVQQAKSAGIDGFLTSWKHTDTLDRRLDLLLRIAASEHFEVGVVYQSLDFSRLPLPVATVRRDMLHLVDRWGPELQNSGYGKPLIIWTGTDLYPTADVHAVRQALGERALLLATSHSVSGYERVARLVDGEAYYWSSADPASPSSVAKLTAMSRAVHAFGGLWLAPVAGGYDGRTLGGTRVVGRDQGRTLLRSLDNAFSSGPDGVAVISWNEWSENTYIEPGLKYGQRELVDLKDYLVARGKVVPPGLAGQVPARSRQPAGWISAPTGSPGVDSSATGDPGSGWTGARAALALGLLTLGAVPGLSLVRRRRTLSADSRHRR